MQIISRLFVTFGVLCLLGLGQATAQGHSLPPLLPKIYQVTGVAQDDVLNVREAATHKSESLGALASDALVEVTAVTADGKWARIIHYEQDGWVSTRYLEIINGKVNDDIPTVMICIGTEPFWSLGFSAYGDEAKLEFQDMDRDPREWTAARISTPTNRGARSFSAVESDVVAVFSRHACSDDMSDRTYGMVVDLLFLGEQQGYLQGCCQMVLD